MEHARYDQLEPYVTRDGSTIREWAGPGYAAEATAQSLAEATVAPGGVTIEHLHRRSEELYLITAGSGLLRVGDEERRVEAGDCVAIAPGTPHRLRNDADVDLVVVCACAPPYSHEDTILLREAQSGDEMAVAEVHVRSWQEAYKEIMPAEFLAALDPGERAGRYEFGDGGPTTVVAVEVGEAGDAGDPSLTNSGDVRSGSPASSGERITGFVTFGASRDEDAEGLAEIYALYVDPGSYRGGLGRGLMAAARGRLLEAGFSGAVLWVLQGNERAIGFYEGEGWRPDGATRMEQPYGIVSDVRRLRRAL